MRQKMGCDSTWRAILYEVIQRKSRSCPSPRHSWLECRIVQFSATLCTDFIKWT